MENSVFSDWETVEHLNSTNSRLRGHIRTLEDFIRAFQSYMENRVIRNTNRNRNNNGNSNDNCNINYNVNINLNLNRNVNLNVNDNGNINNTKNRKKYCNGNRNKHYDAIHSSHGCIRQRHDPQNPTGTKYLWTHGKTLNDLHTSGVICYSNIGHKRTSVLDNPRYGSIFGM